ncbi:MAG TPA: metallophosphoesterase [Archaeoglobus profundus]|nr:metallophosphoesterase [Archaeoglobus profundus]
MKIGLISDVHGNLIALEKVLDKLNHCDKIYCAGDIVGYYPFPNEVIEVFIKNNIESVMGNHDYAVITNDFSGFNPYAKEAGVWTRRRLKKEYLDWLSKLPLKIKTKWFNIYHGVPADDLTAIEIYLYPGDPMIDGFLRILKKNVIVGHTHIQFVRELEGVMFINPGSVGQPRDGDPRAAYAIFDTETNKVELYRVKYNIDEVCDAVHREGLPDFLCSRLYEGY